MRWLIQKIFAEVIDAVTLLGKVNHQITFKRNEIVNNALSEDYKTICGQDHSDSKELLGDIWLIMWKRKGYTFQEPVNFK